VICDQICDQSCNQATKRSIAQDSISRLGKLTLVMSDDPAIAIRPASDQN
jgi:hypothetical protein